MNSEQKQRLYLRAAGCCELLLRASCALPADCEATTEAITSLLACARVLEVASVTDIKRRATGVAAALTLEAAFHLLRLVAPSIDRASPVHDALRDRIEEFISAIEQTDEIPY